MVTEPKVLYEFGPFRVDPERQALLREEQPVAITPKVFETLLILVRQSPEVVSKEDLMKALWPNAFVEEANLSQNIFMLRKALGDSSEDRRYIVTLPGRGYRFAEQVRAVTQNGKYAGVERRSRSQMIVEPVDEDPKGAANALPIIPHRRTRWKYALAAAAVLVLLVVGSVSVLHKRQPIGLSKTASVLIADFTNTTGDPVFDGTLRQGLSVQLEQSPFLIIASDGRIQQTLKLMGQPADAKITPAVARELCQRAGSETVLDGSVAQVGTRYLLTLKAVLCSTGDTLASVEAQASDKNHVLDALGKTASDMRNKLGESLSTVQKFDTPLEQATTGSLEALQSYTLGRKESARNNWPGAIPFFQRAVSLDPGFAMAYSRLGTSYRNLGEVTLGFENLEKAYELREQVSAPEKFYIEGHYFDYGVANLQKAVRTYETWAQTYPRDWVARVDLCALYSNLGELDKALAEGLETVRITPTGVGYVNLFNGYLRLGRWKEARTTAQEAQAKQLDSLGLRAGLYNLDFLENDATGMAQQKLWAGNKPGVEDGQLNREASTAAYSGKLRLARDLSRQAMASAKRAEETELVARYEANSALWEALFGNSIKARKRATDAFDSSKGWEVECRAAMALVTAGDTVRAGNLAEDLDKRFPENTVIHSIYLPVIRAQLALNRKESLRAIEVLQATEPYELSATSNLYPVYVRGEAYLAAHQGDKAAVEFQKLLDHRGIVVNAPIGALAHLGLGRAYALSGEKTKAKSAYRDFLTLWKDADADIPILKQAKAEYAKFN